MIANPRKSRFDFVIKIVLLVNILFSLTVLLGWFLHIEILKSVVPGFSTMKFNSALCVFLLGWILFSSIQKERFYVTLYYLLSVVVFAIGFSTLLASIFEVDYVLDELLMQDTKGHLLDTPFPGRMSRTTSFSFTAFSLAFLMIRSNNRVLKSSAQYAFHIVSLISFIAIIGYLYGVPAFHSFTRFESMAIPTALLFFISSIAATLLHPNYGITSLFIGNRIGNIVVRKIFPISTIAIVLLGFFHILSNRYGAISVELGITLFMLSFILVTLIILGRTALYLNRIDLKRSQAEDSLLQLNNSLEEIIKERTKELESSEEKFFKIFHMNPAGMILSDIDTKQYLEVNKGFSKLTGYTMTEVAGKTAVELGLISPEDREKLISLLIKKGRLSNYEITYYTKKGIKKAGLLSSETIEVLDKKYGLTIIYDITERKELEEKIVEASKTKERFMANMSHEIRTPMNAIIGFTNLIDKNDLNETNKEYLNYIKSSGENLLVLINDILDYSKIEAGMLLLEKIPFKINDLMQSVMIMFTAKADEKGLSFDLTIDKKMPNLIIGDPTRLTQILINLIGNAIKFTEKGSIKVTITVLSIENDLATIMLSVKDTGKGIPKDMQNEIFERFVQASAETTRDFGGSGLGLSIVKNLVHMQKGTIKIDSTENEGTEFMITLSYKIENENLKIETEKLELETILKLEKFDREIKILLAEDNSLNQLLAKNVLTRFGCAIDIAENGAIAVEMLRYGHYDLVLMDIQMPIMDGYTASQNIRAEVNKAIPIIAMTAHVMTGEKEKCISFGMNDYISKPFKLQELYRIIQKYSN